MNETYIRAAQHRLRCLLDSQYFLTEDLKEHYAGATDEVMRGYKMLQSAFTLAIEREAALIAELSKGETNENTSV